MTTTIQRVENGGIAVAVMLLVIAAGHPWWAPLAAFLLFDLSALGYLRGPRAGAIGYNVVHSYAGPSVAAGLYLALRLAAVDVPWLGLLAACWAFHVAVDRALGYGLKLHDFRHTHLGTIGRDAARPAADAGEPSA